MMGINEITRLSQKAVKESRSITWLANETGLSGEWAEYYYKMARVAFGERNVQLSRPEERSEAF